MIRIDIKNPDGSEYGWMELPDQDSVNAYIQQCTQAGAPWTRDNWLVLSNGDPKIAQSSGSQVVNVPDLLDGQGNVVTPAYSYTLYNWRCIVTQVDTTSLPPTPDQMAEIRAQRDALLAACDWTQLADSPLTTDKKTAWATYRQALRNLPDQSGLTMSNLTWPTKPG